ncbi:MAG: alpha-1,2-fucosyltransferase [Mycoplasmataceae bacterium]|nr:alpha-1,2-fucosyltransferase [Mycoplasmataceae bacterium]
MLPLYIDERLEEYEKEFKLWLKPKHDLDLSKYYDEIKQCPNPICMHVRRGDSLYEWKKIKQEQIIDFYIREVNNFAKLNSESKCFIFSDDLVWCKKNFDKVLFNCKIVFCDAFSRQQAINEVFLMSKCKKFVTSYSQFAKLAYSLCEDKEKERVQLNLESKGISNSMF